MWGSPSRGLLAVSEVICGSSAGGGAFFSSHQGGALVGPGPVWVQLGPPLPPREDAVPDSPVQNKMTRIALTGRSKIAVELIVAQRSLRSVFDLFCVIIGRGSSWTCWLYCHILPNAARQFKPFGSVHGSFKRTKTKCFRCLGYSKILWRYWPFSGEGRAWRVHPCSDEEKIARRWQEVPNLRSISHAHQWRQDPSAGRTVRTNDWCSCH
jgi:hypothetical protein